MARVLTLTLIGFVLLVSVYLHASSNSDIGSKSVGSFAFCFSLNKTGDELPSLALFRSSIKCRYESDSIFAFYQPLGWLIMSFLV